MENVPEGIDLLPGVYEGMYGAMQPVCTRFPTPFKSSCPANRKHTRPAHTPQKQNENTGGLKVWESSVDLVRFMRQQQQQGALSLGPTHAVLELGCGHGLPGIHALQSGAWDSGVVRFVLLVLMVLLVIEGR